jgi:tetratricopeptide (TPR) repeat protein
LIRGLAAKRDFADIDKQLATLESLGGRPLAQGFRGTIAAARGDYSESARLFREVMESDDVKEASRATAQLANLEADQGRIDSARQILIDGILKDRATGEDGFASQKSAALAYLEGIAKNPERAVARAKDAISIERSPLVIVEAVSILARYGSPEEATNLMYTFPAGEGPKYDSDLLRMRGEIFLARRNFKQALDLLDRAANLDRPQKPKEYLARAFDLAGDHERATLVNRRIVDTSFLTWITEDEWPATRFLARKYLKDSKGE